MPFPARTEGWAPVAIGPADTAGVVGAVAAERAALGTGARVVAWPPEDLGPALAAVDAELARLEEEASRFRDDSELSRVHRDPGPAHQLSGGLAEAIGVALAAARWTGGLVDPTVGGALIALGYDRDFACLAPDPAPAEDPGPAPGWRSVTLDGTTLRLPAGVRLDLGATAKGLGSDRAAAAAHAACGRGGILVSLGGDIAVAGLPPVGGWPVAVADSSDAGAPDQVVRLTAGALATSSVTGRRWRRGGRPVHHILDPRTGWPADGPWRTVSVAAASCAEANAAATAAIVAGRGAETWLASTGLPARLVARDGTVRRLGGWPALDGTLPGPLYPGPAWGTPS
jgi:FAD:protein FMN transferase